MQLLQSISNLGFVTNKELTTCMHSTVLEASHPNLDSVVIIKYANPYPRLSIDISEHYSFSTLSKKAKGVKNTVKLYLKLCNNILKW